MEELSQIESEDARQKRIKMYKSVLNYYQSRSLSLDLILCSKQANVTIPSDGKSKEGLSKVVDRLYDDVTLFQSLKQSLQLVKNSLTSVQLMNSGALQQKKDIAHKIEGIVYLSKSFMELYSNRPTELELVEKMKTYSGVLAEYGKSLEALKESQKEGSTEESEKAELQVYKVNLTRMIKFVLIGFISVNYPGMLKFLEQFRTPVRRNLTVDDFIDSWDVGLPPA